MNQDKIYSLARSASLSCVKTGAERLGCRAQRPLPHGRGADTDNAEHLDTQSQVPSAALLVGESPHHIRLHRHDLHNVPGSAADQRETLRRRLEHAAPVLRHGDLFLRGHNSGELEGRIILMILSSS